MPHDEVKNAASDAQSAEVDAITAARAVLHWYAEMGVDEAVLDAPRNFFADAPPAKSNALQTPAPQSEEPEGEVDHWRRRAEPPQKVTTITGANSASADEASTLAARIASGCETVDDLAKAVADFDACPLKKGARSTVFVDGAVGADLLVLGEAPGRDEDRVGKPFVGRAGQLLDRMLAAIGRSREQNVLITNVIFWRPPGNRTPTQSEVLVCKPFVDRLIELTRPKAIVLAGNAPLQAMTGATGITRARGKWRDLTIGDSLTAPAMPIFHPSFLLRRPEQKRLAWADLQSLSKRLTDS